MSNDVRPLDELASSGLLWLINRAVFHPRGYALALHLNHAGEVVGWTLEGDGSEPWSMGADIPEAELLRAVERTLGEAKRMDDDFDPAECPGCMTCMTCNHTDRCTRHGGTRRAR